MSGGSKQNSCHKRRRSVTPINTNIMRPPIAIAPKTNLPKNLQNVEILSTIKAEPAGFLTIIPNSRSTNQILSEIDIIERHKKSAISLKTDEYTEIHFESNAVLQNTAKRIKISNNTDDNNIIPMQYIILQNQNIDHFNTIVIADNNDDKISTNQKLEYKIIKNNVNNNGIMQQFNNIVDHKSNSSNSNCNNTSSGILAKLNFNNQDQEMNSTVQTNSEKKNHFINSIQRNNTNSIIVESSSHSSIPLLQKCNIINECKQSSIISRNHLKTDITIDNKSSSDSLNIVSIENLESLNSFKCINRSQKPVVIMQQQLSPPNKTEISSSIKTKRILPISADGLNKLSPITDIQGVNIESKINLSNQQQQQIISSPLKSNENYYHNKIISINNNNTNITVNNDDDHEQETDHFLLKKEFPVISSSQVDSVLKAIDMQGLNRGIVSNEINNYSKKDITGNKERIDNLQSLPASIQGGDEKLCKNENRISSNTVIDDNSIKIQETNRSIKRFLQSEKQGDDYFKIAEKFTPDSLQFFKCKECSYMSLNEKHIFEHKEREHVNVSQSREKPILKCPGCSNTFHHEASLLSHIVHDHQVHESEARIMAHELSLRENSTSDVNDSEKRITQTQLTEIQNEKNIVNQRTDDTLIGNNETSKILSTLTLPKIINSVGLVQSDSSLPSVNNVIGEIGSLEYIQSINNMPVIIEQSSLKPVDIINPFLNDDDNNKYPVKLVDVKENHELVENKNADCLEKPNLFELKNVGEQRNFEFVNFKNVANSDGDGYLQEEDTIERGISDSEIEFNDLNTVKKSGKENEKSETKAAVKIKKKGRPKGSKSYATKPQLMSFKQGYKCEVEDCVVRMLVQENITYHQKCHVITPTATTQPRNFNFQCPECTEFKTNNWNNLAGHLWRSHIIDMELHSCDLCSYKTPSFSHLTNQHRGIHGDDRPFVCDDCGKGFKTTKQLRNHRALHNAKTKEPLKCDECKRDFTNTRLLKLHKDSVHKESKPFTCSSCPYSAATRSALKLHMRRHTGEKPFSCEQCSYSTGDHNSLRRHKLRHLGLKPYSCPHCNYACIQSSTYKVHLKNKHPGLDHELMFSCQYCSYKSIKKDNLLTHMAKHEQIISNSSNKIQTNSGSLILGE